jgi:hypothetical protein
MNGVRAGVCAVLCVLGVAGCSGQRNDAPPYPDAAAPDKILANVLYGARQMKLPAVEGTELFGKDDALVIARILDVFGQDFIEDYYIVQLNDKAGRAYADVAVSRKGWIKSVADVRAGRVRNVHSLDEVTIALRKRFGDPVNAQYYFAGGNIGAGRGSEYLPLIKAQTPDGVVFVDVLREMYREQSLQKYGPSIADDTQDLAIKRRGEYFMVRRDGIATMVKIGTLQRVPERPNQ